MQVQSSNPVPAVFSFDSLEVRTLLIGDKPYFVASDIASALGYAKPRNAISQHCKGALIQGVPTNGGIQDMTIIPEGDVFRLIVRSNLPAAEKFEAWVMDEVLPAIRKTGSYGVPALPTDPMAILKLVFESQVQTNERVAAVETKIQEFNDNIRLHQWQCYELKLAVTNKVNEFHKQTGVERKSLYSGMWNRLKLQMHVASYQAIPAVKFDEALSFASGLSIHDMPDYVKAQALDLQGGAA